MPKRKSLARSMNVHALSLELQTKAGDLSFEHSYIAKKTNLPLWFIEELDEANALRFNDDLDFQLLEVLSFCFSDRRFLSSAMKKIPKKRRERVLFPEDNHPIALRLESLARNYIKNGWRCRLRTMIYDVRSILPKTTAKYSDESLRRMAVRAIKKVKYQQTKKNGLKSS